MDPSGNTTRIPVSRDLHDCTLLFRAIPTTFRFTAEEKRNLKRFARDLASRVADGYTFTCLFSGDAELRRLNKAFLGHDYPTDVLSFPSAGGTGLGEIAISVERADAQATEFGHTRLDEVRLLMLHGVLHLKGLDHEIDKGEMRRAEQKWRLEFELPSALIARAGRAEARR